ncbi:MAG: hypothetical protein PHV37_01125 [Candidatus Gastranaerophilales bacterium]|nr:hypothetical protein [Candidatus Gastranaerophilales bacterium]
MHTLSTLGKYLDQPRLVGQFTKKVPYILIGGGVVETFLHTKKAPDKEKKDEFIRTAAVMTGSIGSALLATRGIKKLGIKGLSAQIDLEKLKANNNKLTNNFLEKNKTSPTTEAILNKAKNKIIKFKEINHIYNELQPTKKGKDLLSKLIPEPANVTSKEIFKEIKRLSLMGLIPVIGGIAGGIAGDKITDKNWKEKVPNKIKEGAYQYLANIFLCNVGAGIALEIMEKAKITSKKARAIGMIIGIGTVGVLGGSAIANCIGKNLINPILNKNKKEKTTSNLIDIAIQNKSNEKEEAQNLYAERKPEALDIGLHLDDIATVAVLSGLKWIEPSLPMLYSISGYRAGIGYRNGKETNNNK